MCGQDRISPYNINTISSRQVLRLKKNINPNQILKTNITRTIWQTVRRYWRERKKVLETFYVKWNFVMNVNWDGNSNICETLRTITFPCKQTIMKHEMTQFNLTQFECRIQKLINLQGNGIKLNAFFLPLTF